MWPWEHLAFAYVLYSLFVRVVDGRTPSTGAVYAVALGSQFPDLVDKPLAWTLGFFESGYAVAHSILVFPIFAAAVLWLSNRWGRVRIATAFLVGHITHMLGDILYPLITKGELAPTAVLWPIVVQPSSEVQAGLIARTLHYFVTWFAEIRALDPGPLLLFEAGLALLVLLLWILDGTPGIPDLRGHFSR